MRRRFGSIMGVALFALATHSAPARAEGGFPEPERDFSADLSMKLEGGPQGPMESRGRAYVGNGHQRREISAMGQQTTIIERADGTVFTLIPAQKMVIESKGGKAAKDSGPNPMGADDAKLEKIGSETVNGLETDKYEVTSPDSTGTAWMTSDHVPVRYEGQMQSEGRSMSVRMDYTNHQFGEQPAHLFEVPADYSAMPSFGGMGMPGATPGAPGMPSEAEMKRKLDQLRKQMEHLKQQPKP